MLSSTPVPFLARVRELFCFPHNPVFTTLLNAVKNYPIIVVLSNTYIVTYFPFNSLSEETSCSDLSQHYLPIRIVSVTEITLNDLFIVCCLQISFLPERLLTTKVKLYSCFTGTVNFAGYDTL